MICCSEPSSLPCCPYVCRHTSRYSAHLRTPDTKDSQLRNTSRRTRDPKKNHDLPRASMPFSCALMASKNAPAMPRSLKAWQHASSSRIIIVSRRLTITGSSSGKSQSSPAAESWLHLPLMHMQVTPPTSRLTDPGHRLSSADGFPLPGTKVMAVATSVVPSKPTTMSPM